MSYKDKAGEHTAFARLFYSGNTDPLTRTYINKPKILNPARLELHERDVTAERAAEGFPPNAHGLTYDGYKSIHHHLFQDIYSWAGKERLYTPEKGGTVFTRVEVLKPYMESIFKSLKAENHLEGLSKERFAERAAHFVNNINAGHPFVDGNGRTQRAWLRLMADRAGFQFELRSADKDDWQRASFIGFHRTDQPMTELIAARLYDRGKGKSQDSPELQQKAKRAAERFALSKDAGKDPERER
ncbi:hypothetical protein GRI72_09375 [Altererythrobacter marinus]|uniref:protein adenylyltransferase n=1 Tax=Pelagerythrobacter marinus TaxID=538382 RepID=A0ABW9UW14_9SPHN|nr:hypothetical protein [Pelagerythrobacter marinus]